MTELKLENGRYTVLPGGGLASVCGDEAVLQRAVMRLSARRGAFLPDADYGSRLSLLGRLKPSQRPAAAALYVAEALGDEPALSVRAVDYVPGTGDQATVSVTLEYAGRERSISVGV